MKYIKLFEDFDQSKIDLDIKFDWIPFDSEVNNSLNSSIPTDIGLSELMEYCNTHPEINSIGLFIGHKKNNDGFSRYITSSMEPLRLDYALFDKDFKKIDEKKGIDPTKISMGDFDRGSSMLGRFGLFGNKDEE